VVKSDGSIWFSDPTYGIDSEYEGDAAPSEIGASHVYRIDPASREVTPSRPTSSSQRSGLCADERLLYIADTGATHVPDGPHHIRRFNVAADGRRLSAVKYSRNARWDSSTASASMSTATCGAAPATACIAMRPTARCSARY